MLTKLFFRKKIFTTDTTKNQVSADIYVDVIRILRGERDRYRRLALYLAEMASMYPTVYEGKPVDYILTDLENLFESAEQFEKDERA